MLPQLIDAAVALPNLELDDGDQDQEHRNVAARAKVQRDSTQWAPMYESLKTKFGDWNLYWGVFNPLSERETIRGSLADDIADIYGDLKDGVILHENREVPAEDNIWHWRCTFYVHWGEHATDALRTIYFILRETAS